jgi:hypothetical protein
MVLLCSNIPVTAFILIPRSHKFTPLNNFHLPVSYDLSVVVSLIISRTSFNSLTYIKIIIFHCYNPRSCIHPQMSESDDHSVTLTNLPRDMSGHYKCEVSTDAPLFHTQIKESYITIIGKLHCPDEQ